MNETRRGWIAGILGLFGFGIAGKVEAVQAKPKLEGFIVFHVNVGSLPPYKAEAFIERLKERWKKDKENGKGELIANWQTIWIPTRTQDTEAYFYPLNGNMDANGRLEDIQGYFYEEMADSNCCPDCGSIDVRPIVYGYPDEEMCKRQQRGECVLGGCCISQDSPSKRCMSCETKFGNYNEESKVVT
jgi:hypothetical protein